MKRYLIFFFISLISLAQAWAISPLLFFAGTVGKDIRTQNIKGHSEAYSYCAGSTLNIISDSGSIVEFFTDPPPSGLPKGIKMPCGKLTGTISKILPGETVTFTWVLPSASKMATCYIKSGTTWVNIVTAVTVDTANSYNILTMSITDGSSLDGDGVANGIIIL